MPTRTFLDTCVLINAHHGIPTERELALEIVSDASRLFIASPFLQLELMPKAVYNNWSAEVDFYNRYFERVFIWINQIEEIVRIAREEAERCDLRAMDALHIAAAHLGEADVLYTFEKKKKVMQRTSLVRVVSLGGEERV